MKKPGHFLKDKWIVVLIVLGLLCPCVLSGCHDLFDANQVQVVKDTSEFKAFSLPAGEVAYGPYSMITADRAAIIAWEEKECTGKLRHVEVPFDGLDDGTRYFYSVNGVQDFGGFLTAPTADSPFNFLLWSDSRTGTDVAAEIAQQMIRLVPDASFALHAGDFVIDGDREECWAEEWWAPMRDLLLHCPIYPTMGNHEEDSPYYYRYFSALGRRGTNYSFDWGSAHFVVCKIDEGDSEQLEWLEDDLFRNSDAGFTVVSHHVPPFSSTTSDTGGIPYLQDSVVPLFEKYGVDLVVSGDIHSYQHHVRNNINYLTSAGGGEKPYDYGLPLEGMTLTLLKTYNFSRCRLENNRMYVTTYNEVGECIDSFEILPDSPPIITSTITVETSDSRVITGGQCRVDFYIDDVKELDALSLTLKYYKDYADEKFMLLVIDEDPVSDGSQIGQGGLGGTVQINRADNASGVLQYREEDINDINGERIKVASAILEIPDDAPVTAMYLIPEVTLVDTSGAEIPHFMGGAKIVITKE